MKSIIKFFADILKSIIKFFLIVCIIAIAVSVIIAPKDEQSTANLARLDLKDAILDSEEFLQAAETLYKNDNIKGVLLFIDSPGGGLSPSFEIAMAIKRLNEKKPVVAYASGTMASGSYLGGVWAKEIYANKGAFIGSIGVIMQGFNIQGLADKIGIKEQIVSAGEYKQAGTFMREWTKEERQSVQELTDKSYELFTNEVAEARNLDINKKDEWANARVFLADDAKTLKLIDGVATYSDVKSRVEELSGVESPIWQKEPMIDRLVGLLSKNISSKIVSFFMLNAR
ncbi:signal peptide peptidase SppA [uncultured Campylobacter sp.]|uniref:signal peptide peptidase SppA n=1 Tax=uncultured Campylobacter sp. TaxID=218934 RepID=UPI00261A45F1|nr:signal peptide peptidase SppA [uncultured Campylobacter sp.]